MTNETECSKCDKAEVCKYHMEYGEIVKQVEKSSNNPIAICKVSCRFFKVKQFALTKDGILDR